MGALYKNKWVNADLLIDSRAFITIAIGARGIGKSYGCLKELYIRKIPFIYCRRTQAQLDETTSKSLNPYNKIAADIGVTIVTDRIGKHSVGFYNANIEDGKIVHVEEPFSVGVALSTFSNIRGISAESFEVLLFDEIIPERHERKIPNEGLAFLNMLESLNRNRELSGLKPLHVILLSNSNTINSQILDSIGCLREIDNMTRSGKERSIIKNGLVEIIIYKDSPISEEKAKTALYQVANNSDFMTMAIENRFAGGDYEQVKPRPIKEYYPIVSYGNCTVFKHKSKQEYYCIDGIKAEKHFEKLPLSKINFSREFGFLYSALIKGKVYYSSVTAKIEFEGAFA